MPPPGFLVPAIFETLKTSQEYSSITHLVAGEADAFCARHAHISASLVLTSDSDLLVHDLGDGAVCLFREINLALRSGRDCLLTKEYHPKKISERLGLLPADGLCRFAFQLQQHPTNSISRIVSSCSVPVLDPESYKSFLQEYRNDDSQLEDLSVLRSFKEPIIVDVRLAELIFQLVQKASQKTGLLSASNDDECLVFLPILVDSTTRPSAWESSNIIRRLSYSLAARTFSMRTGKIREYRRMQTSSTRAREVEFLAEEEILAASEELIALFERLSLVPEALDTFWYIIAMGQSVATSESEGKKGSVADLLTKNNAWASGFFSWEFVHFVAEVHASMYSLRMLCQALELSLGLGCSISRSLTGLQDYLRRLPSLENYPTFDTMAAFLGQMKNSTALVDILLCFNISEVYLSTQVLRPRKARRKNFTQNAALVTEQSKRDLSENAFALLSD